jgi:hypothetical protein
MSCSAQDNNCGILSGALYVYGTPIQAFRCIPGILRANRVMKDCHPVRQWEMIPLRMEFTYAIAPYRP